MTDQEDITTWPQALRLLALTFEAQQALGWARELRREGGAPDVAADLRRRVAPMQQVLDTLHEVADPLAAAARAFADALADCDHVPPPGRWAEADALKAAIHESVRRDLPPPARSTDEWAWRMQRLAARPWIGDEVWGAPAGWLPILERAAKQAEGWTGPRRVRRGWRTDQIKEKFGGLRWYCTGDPRLHVIVDVAELASLMTCQACGAKGQLRPDRAWVVTLCDEHDAMDRAGFGEEIGRLCYPPRPRRDDT